MPAATHDIIIEQGATFELRLSYLTAAGGPPVNLTGYAARMQVREFVGSDTALLSLTSEPGGGIALGGAAGTVVIEATDEQTAAIPTRQPMWAAYDIELVPPNGRALRLLEGTAHIRPEVTR